MFDNIIMKTPIIYLDKNDKMTNKIEDVCNKYPFITLNDRQLCDFEMIHNKSFDPLTGFMIKEEYDSVIDSMTLPNGSIWPIPITLHVSKKWLLENLINKFLMEKNNYSFEDVIASKNFKNCLVSLYTVLKNETGVPLVIMKNESIYEMDLLREAEKVYDAITDNKIDTNHPYVNILVNYQSNELTYCLGGRFIFSVNVPRYDFMQFRRNPSEVKEEFEKLGWNVKDYNIIGFQTRNPLHKSHFQLTKYALKEATRLNGKPSKLLLHPVVGITQNNDIEYHTRVKCYKELIQYYDENEAILSLLPLSMRMAGPREAIWHAIIRKNYGVTHFVIGRDHAGPSVNRSNGKQFYGPYDAQNQLVKYADSIGITVLTSKMIVFSVDREKIYSMYSKLYHKNINEITDDKIRNLEFMCKLNETDGEFKSIENIDSDKEFYFEISGTQQRKLLKENKPIPNWFSYPKIIEILRKDFQKRKGIVFYFVGLSGSGKSTLANNLIAVLKELTFREISYLDGDIIRLNLSKGLGFSKEDRSINVRRIGYVASEIAKHGGICIVANIAPYEEDRKRNKEIIEGNGGIYIEIFVDTSVEICEKRDIKGLYKLAKENKINLTGINDPFEIPENPNIRVNGNDDIKDILKTITDYIENNDYVIE